MLVFDLIRVMLEKELMLENVPRLVQLVARSRQDAFVAVFRGLAKKER